MTTNTYPTDDQIELVRLREALAELSREVEGLEARIDDEDPLAVELAGLSDDLGRGLRRLERLAAGADPVNGVIHSPA